MRKLRLIVDDLVVTPFATEEVGDHGEMVGANAVTGTAPYCQTVPTYCRTGCPCTT